jgi:hypothetical protein
MVAHVCLRLKSTCLRAAHNQLMLGLVLLVILILVPIVFACRLTTLRDSVLRGLDPKTPFVHAEFLLLKGLIIVFWRSDENESRKLHYGRRPLIMQE